MVREGRRFLDDMKGLPDGHVLTTRQGEFLVDLRDEVEQVSKYRGFSIGILIERCLLNRLDLADDGDIEFIERVKQLGNFYQKGLVGTLAKVLSRAWRNKILHVVAATA
jgi:hypothetical protein